MAMKYSILLKLLRNWSLTIRLFSVISRTLVSGGLTPLQRCSRCFLQPLPIALISVRTHVKFVENMHEKDKCFRCQIIFYVFTSCFYHLQTAENHLNVSWWQFKWFVLKRIVSHNWTSYLPLPMLLIKLAIKTASLANIFSSYDYFAISVRRL